MILAVKAQILAEIVAQLGNLLHSDSVIVPMQNGRPWWYFQKHGGEYDGRSIACLDPDGTRAAHVDADRILGCVIFPAGEIVSPGVIRHTEGNRFAFGESTAAARHPPRRWRGPSATPVSSLFCSRTFVAKSG